MSQDWLTLAKSELNKPYIWGGGRVGSNPAGFDCSGFVSFIMKNGMGIDVPAFTGSAYTSTRPLGKDESPQSGDIVFYNMDNPDPHIQHMALYIGNGQIIQAGGTHSNVNIDSVNSVGTPTFHRANGLNSDLANNMASSAVGNSLPKSASAAPLDYNDKAGMESYIRQAAIARGIDPDVAMTVANSEGFNTYIGDYGTSFGPYQLHYGGGLGDAFTKTTGKSARDQSTVRDQIDYALDNAATNGWGAFHGAARAGIGNFTGIGKDAHAAGTSDGGTGQDTTDPITKYIMSSFHRSSGSAPSLFGGAFGQSSNLFGGNIFGGGPSNFPSIPNVSWQNAIQPNFQIGTPLIMTPMSLPAGPKSIFDAPNAPPNIMSRMSRPGSLYGG